MKGNVPKKWDEIEDALTDYIVARDCLIRKIESFLRDIKEGK
jgi:hypothetical protein